MPSLLLITLAALLLAVPVALSASEPKPGQRIDLKVLVITTAGNDSIATAWESALDREGVPHDRKYASAGLTDADLADYSANRAKYQAVIVAPGDEAMSATTTQALTKLQTTFGVRRLSDQIADPTLHGLSNPTFAEQGGSTGTLTADGKAAFPYLDGPVPIEAPFAFGFQATPAAGADFKTLVAGPGGSAYLGINTLADGRQEMVNAVNGNATQTHHQLLRHGVINWLTRGVFLGHQRDYFAMQVDDVFLPDDRWDVTRNLTGVDGPTTATDEYTCDHVIDNINDCKPIRMTAADVNRLVAWQNTSGLKLDMAFNGDGSEEAIEAAAGAPDPLTDAFVANKAQFHWINHTWSHLQLDALNQTQLRDEIARNIEWAQAPQRALPIDPTELVTGEHSGLHNASMPAAINQTGIRWIAADNSREPNPYAIGQATTVPRYPSNVYYNVATMAEQLDEYNYIYLPPALGGKCVNSPTNTCLGAAATWQQYLDSESNIMLDHLMGNDPKPHYAHQSNLVSEDGVEKAVLYQVLEGLLARYQPYFNTPLVQLTHAEIGQEMQRQRAWKAASAAVSAYVQDGQVHVVNTTGGAIDVPLTGTSVGSAYGGQRSGWTNVPASSERVFAPSDPANTALPTVTGSVATVGGTLTATTGTWSGTPTIGLSLQWQRCNIQGAACESIPGAIASTYTTQAADKDKRLRVVVSAANWISSYSQAQSAVTEVVEPTIAPASTEAPALSGTAAVGQKLTCSQGTWTGSPAPTFAYQWKRDGANIAGATDSTYTVVAGDAGHALTCTVTATNAGGSTSASSNSLTATSRPANTGAPAVTGSALTGQTLSCSQGTWTGSPTPSFAYQWKRAGGNIAGATASTYLLVAGDVGQAIKCTVTATNSQDSASADSNSVVPSAASPNPTPPQTGAPAGPAPRVSLKALRISPKRYGLTGSPRSARLSWNVSDRATLRLTLKRSLPGRRVAGVCRAPSKGNSTRPACGRLVTVAAFNRPVAAGAGGLTLTGKVGGRKLPAGSYRLVVTAMNVDASRRPSTQHTLGFAVLKELR